ncbi:TetR/AcrR family transcriptional regulator [Labrenzia sp. PHM005]|uniref:TetR/AcrR family transcriptional regulator n=1 Tax=Labrenzia sp. PHM005 TaxID=2590016 RepID=UPI00114034E3|nr:TetR/AcrR family transcriptional regulator [Labrenzia sp. PHM005]QDG75241.1 TetR/AcrR family transcriptional regulator [Labrenzia sp. PHM005]
MTQKKRFGKDDWITLGFRQLIKDGINGLTLDALCRTAGRTKGSFYHHFKDHNAYLVDLVEAWKQQNTLDVAAETMADDPATQAQTLANLATHLDHDLERAMRQFAQVHETARLVVRQVDQIRTSFIFGLYRAQGLDKEAAADIAKIEYAAFVGAQIVWPEMTPEDRLALDKRFAKMVQNCQKSDFQ